MRCSIRLPPDPRSAGTAREFVGRQLHGAVRTDVADTAVLLTSELVTNVIVHARTELRLDVDYDGERIVVGVADEVARAPTLRGQGDGARLTGRGVHLVALLARRWGAEPEQPGKRVWFELPA